MGRAYFAESERKEAKKRSEEEEVANDIKKVRDWLQEMDFATEKAKEQFEGIIRRWPYLSISLLSLRHEQARISVHGPRGPS